MAKQMSISEARQELTSLPDQLEKDQQTVAVTRRGKPVLAVLPWELYESLVETLEVLSDEKLMQALHEALSEVERGEIEPWDEVRRDLRL
jgi:prevent-host-death family protein